MNNSQQEPRNGFTGFDLGPSVQRGIRAVGFVEPRPIQERTIPAALEGRDILGLAQTGTGKTAAFALPILERLLATRGATHPRVLIVAPTRELASQIGEEIRSLARFTRIKVATVFGGVSFNKQITELAPIARRSSWPAPAGCWTCSATAPYGSTSIETLVLDEADHMFDMGFLPDVRRILAALPERRQNLLFSATMPREIRRLAKGLLRDPHVVELDHTRPLETIEHALYPIDEGRKLDLLEHVLSGDDFVSAIVFTRTKHRAKRLAQKTRPLRTPRRGVTGQHVPERAGAGDERFPQARVRCARGDRHRGSRPRHRAGLARRQLRHAQHAPTRTPTGSAAPAGPSARGRPTRS